MTDPRTKYRQSDKGKTSARKYATSPAGHRGTPQGQEGL